MEPWGNISNEGRAAEAQTLKAERQSSRGSRRLGSLIGLRTANAQPGRLRALLEFVGIGGNVKQARASICGGHRCVVLMEDAPEARRTRNNCEGSETGLWTDA